MEQIKGEVQNIKENNFAIQNIWYNNKFKKLPEGFRKGVIVEVNYLVKNNKNYWQSLTFEEQVKPLYVEDDIMAEETIKPKYISDTTINTLIMSVKDIYCVALNNEEDITIEDITKDVLNSYKIIVANI